MSPFQLASTASPMGISKTPFRSAAKAAAATGRRFRSIVFVCIASLVLAAPALAAEDLIYFDFTSESFISLLGGTIQTPPDGTLDVGSARLSVEATAPNTYVPGGAVVLDDVDFSGTAAKNIPGQANITGPYAGTQVGTSAGTLAAGETGANFVDDLVLNLNIVLDCTGPGCGLLGFPASEVGVQVLSLSFLSMTDLAVAGSAKVEAVVPISVDGILGELNLVGLETSRTFVPEPNSFLLVGFGLLALGRRRARTSLSRS